MIFNSQELNDVTTNPASLTDIKKDLIDVNELRSLLRGYIFEKDKNLLDIYDIASFNKSVSYSGFENLENTLYSVKKYILNKFNNDKERVLIIENIFTNINNSLKLLKICNIDLTANELNTLILGSLIKNFL